MEFVDNHLRIVKNNKISKMFNFLLNPREKTDKYLINRGKQ